PTYSIGQTFGGVFWPVPSGESGGCMGSAIPRPLGTMTIQGPTSKDASYTISSESLKSGSYDPAIGKPWVAADVGSWNVTLVVSSTYGGCLASGSTTFQVKA